MIRSFKDKETATVFRGTFSRKLPPQIQRRALNKLRVLNAIVDLSELLNPPSNRLEALHGNQEGEFSIRIDDPWRMSFRWEAGDAHDVGIVDYH